MKYICVKCKNTKKLPFNMRWYDFWEVMLLLLGVIPGVLFMLWRQQDKKRLYNSPLICEHCNTGMISAENPDKEWFLKMIKNEPCVSMKKIPEKESIAA